MHRLNPSLKMIGMVFLIVCIFLPSGFFGQAILLLITTVL
jgi:energy-coupling factor transporter transmembrane protein EcfT